MEMWKDIEGFEGRYKVSNEGRVWTELRHRLLTPWNSGHGYKKVTLSDGKGNQKVLFVHRLVAQAFIENPNNLPEVDHINSVRDDNRAENLRWVTPQQNLTTEHRIKLMSKRVRCVETGVIYNSGKEAAEKNFMCKSNISAACHGRIKTAGGFHWEFVKEEE